MGRGDGTEDQLLDSLPRVEVSSTPSAVIDDADIEAVDIYIATLDGAEEEAASQYQARYADSPDDMPFAKHVFLADAFGHSYGSLVESTGHEFEWKQDVHASADQADKLAPNPLAMQMNSGQLKGAMEHLVDSEKQESGTYDHLLGISIYLKHLDKMQQLHGQQIAANSAQIAAIELTDADGQALGLIEFDLGEWVWRLAPASA